MFVTTTKLLKMKDFMYLWLIAKEIDDFYEKIKIGFGDSKEIY